SVTPRPRPRRTSTIRRTPSPLPFDHQTVRTAPKFHDEPDILQLFIACVKDIGAPVTFRSASDKEYGFQDWVRDRLVATGLGFQEGGRNGYPDLKLMDTPDGFEVKSLRHPGRVETMDTNSRPPGGFHDDREIYYVFGRYLRDPANSMSGQVRDLVLYHGDLVDPSRDYEHKNRSFKTFGRYGDVMIRDRKMYVPKTAQGILSGLDDELTLVLPASAGELKGLSIINTVVRHEAGELVRRYVFDFERNSLTTETKPNPAAGEGHAFNVYRPEGREGAAVALREFDEVDFDAVADGADAQLDIDGC
ncbi:MAG: hypothetical protein ACLQBY_10985, partial [Solirubrobacteraceae bacterium]